VKRRHCGDFVHVLIKHTVSIYSAAGVHGRCWHGHWISLRGLMCSFEYQGVLEMK